MFGFLLSDRYRLVQVFDRLLERAISMLHPQSDKECFLCGQIKGESSLDLLARMLPDQPYQRRIILENDEFAVLPSLGALTPGHVLLCPKTHSCSFSHIAQSVNNEVETSFRELKAALSQLLQYRYGSVVHIFEHGMASKQSHVPCTVDHAHLHFIPIPESVEVVPENGDSWSSIGSSFDALARHTGDSEYLLHETPEGLVKVVTGPTGSFASQSLRRLCAARLGCEELWDWKARPQPESADATWRELHGIEQVYRRLSRQVDISAEAELVELNEDA